MKTIRKDYQGTIPTNKILNEQTNSNTDTYSCDYINNMTFSSDGADELPVGTRVEFTGTEIPEGWEQVENTIGDVYAQGEEVIIGTWYGRPLYRKTISTTNVLTANTTMEIPHNIENVHMIWIDNSSTYMSTGSGFSYSLPMVGYNGNITDKTYAYVEGANIKLFSNGNWGTGWTKVITLRYTKKTS